VDPLSLAKKREVDMNIEIVDGNLIAANVEESASAGINVIRVIEKHGCSVGD
jgi:hypothetical protein